MCVCVCVHLCVCMRICVRVCVYMCVCVCIMFPSGAEERAKVALLICSEVLSIVFPMKVRTTL